MYDFFAMSIGSKKTSEKIFLFFYDSFCVFNICFPSSFLPIWSKKKDSISTQ